MGAPRPTLPVVALVSSLAWVALAGTAGWLAFDWPADARWGLAALLAAGTYVAHAGTFVLPWRRHTVAASLDEGAVLMGLLLLPLPLLPWLFGPVVLLAQLRRRRPAQKAAFNVAGHVVGTAVAIAVFLAASPWMAPVLAALVATAAFTLVTNLLVCEVMARLEGTRLLRVFRERLALPAFFQAAVGCAAGVVLLALWDFHPWALLAAVPFAFVAREYAAYRVRSEHVVRAHEGIVRLSGTLQRARTDADVADAVLTTMGELLPVASATIVLNGRSWTRTYGGGPEAGAEPVDSVLVTPDGSVVGTLYLDLLPGKALANPQSSLAILRLLSSEAAIAAERLRTRHVER
ncbi:MAG TPA: hypothetical protein VFH78_05160 [Candidatus Thermoplasmatota archaeon]|nr:hypothetical protein [Candidatus Thermoplasmatota archaeon]